jgi:hypothetical protein
MEGTSKPLQRLLRKRDLLFLVLDPIRLRKPFHTDGDVR